jgi:hypothetical protein
LIREQHSVRGRPAEQSDKTEKIILDTLKEAGGEMLSSELWEIVASEGVSERTYKTVKSRIGVESFQRSRKWYVRVQKVGNGEDVF